jgi:hypothetical protein
MAANGATQRVTSVAGEPVVFDHGQHHRRGPDLQEVGHLRKVGVAQDHVQPAVLLGVAVGLVAGVDDGPLQRRLQAHFLFEEVGPLGDLEVDLSAPVAPRPDLAGAGVDLAGHEVRYGVLDRPVRTGRARSIR